MVKPLYLLGLGHISFHCNSIIITSAFGRGGTEEENAAALNLADRAQFFTGDLLAPLQGNSYTAILSNPPYIPDADIAGLAADVQLSEPHTALAGGANSLTTSS